MITFKKQIINPKSIINRDRKDITNGQPWDMLATGSDRKGQWTRKGWVVWNGKDFIFYPWRKNSKYIKIMQKIYQERKEADHG